MYSYFNYLFIVLLYHNFPSVTNNISTFLLRGEILPGQRVEVSFPFSPIRTGVRKLLVDFDSDRLMDVKGTATLVVRKITGNYIRGISGIFGNLALTDPFV